MAEYYSDRLSASLLKKCYDLAPPRIKAYLQAEIDFVLKFISPSDRVLELGCGYGRVIRRVAPFALKVIGIDTSSESITLGREYLSSHANVELIEMNALDLHFNDQSFDVVIAIQNAISAFKVDEHKLIQEATRVTRKGGKTIFSSYSEKIWNERLEWFERQSMEGLIGEIDYDKTKDGTIICKDSFKTKTVLPDEFRKLTSSLNLDANIEEVDASSIFCIIST